MTNVYEIITNVIVERVQETGILPWKCPWIMEQGGGIVEPRNFVTDKPYRGVNSLLLNFMGYKSPYWLTFNQCQTLKGQVKKGEKGTPIIYWKNIQKTITETDEKGEVKEKTLPPIIKYSTVFNVLKCEGLEIKEIIPYMTLENEKIELAEKIYSNFVGAPDVVFDFNYASYSRETDLVNVPEITSFNFSDEYYSTLFHELIHSTGHEKRLNRKSLINATGIFKRGESYCKEELIAEIGNSFLCAYAGLIPQTFDNSVSYIKGWLDEIKANPKMLIEASSQAQKAVDLILGKTQNLD